MSTLKGNIQSISVDKEKITFAGQYRGMPESGGSFTLNIYESFPFEPEINPFLAIPADQATVAVSKASGSFTLSISRLKNGIDRIYSRFRVGVADSAGMVKLFTGICYVDDLNEIAEWDYEYPTAGTIKGLQVNMLEDAIKLGIGHAALNLNLPTIIRPEKTNTTLTYRMDGQEYYFDGEYLARFDQRVKELSDHNIVVNLILLNSLKWDGIEIHPNMRRQLVHPDYNPQGLISAFNVVTPEGFAYYKAFIEFVAERYTRPDHRYGRACGFIIGNEVDCQWMWCNAGDKTIRQYVREYGMALRTAFYAARKKYAQARIYISLTHHWNMTFKRSPRRFYKGRDVLGILNRNCTHEGNYDWSIAYHPYPQDLTKADFWKDDTATFSLDTGRITFKNIEILSQYLSQPQNLYAGRLRHIILSEQGFHSDENEQSEQLQAAAYAFAFWRIERTPGIEAFILHAHVDNRDEFNLNLGIWRRDKNSPLPNAPGSPKPIYEVFKGIDRPGRETIFEKAKKVVTEEYWK
jgi:Family of unknown function (DUF5722)